MKLGLIGLGLMGSALAERLIGAGHAVQGCDIDPARRRLVQEMGGTPAASAAAAAAGAEMVLTCLMTGAIVREALFGPDGAAAAMDPGAILIDVSTTSPAEARSLAADLAVRGIAALDAPLSGNSREARAGELPLVMAGGPPEAFDRCRPLFETFALRAVHVGPSGAGAAAKLVTNLVLGLNRLALAEGLLLGDRAGLDPAALLAVLRASAAYSRAMDAKGERMIAGDFQPEAKLAQHLKDVHLILNLAREVGTALPTSELHARLLARGVQEGLGDLDNAAIIEVLRRLP